MGRPTGPGVATFQRTPLVVGECAPNTRVLTGLHGPTQTFVNDFALSADGLRQFDLEEGRAGVPDWEEQLRVLA